MKPSIYAAAAVVAAAGALLTTAAIAQPPAGAGRGGAAPPGAAAGGGRGGAAQGQANAAMAHGEDLFNSHCKQCHDPAIERAPNRTQLASYNGEVIINALTTGVMQPMAAGLKPDDINALAVYLTGRAEIRPAFDTANEASNLCPASDKFSAAGPAWDGWSPDVQESRMATNSTISEQDAPKLKVKWAFAYQGGRYGEPTVYGNRVFVTSSSGVAYALDKNTGCVAWQFKTPAAGIRVTASVDKNPKSPSGYAVYFGDFTHNVYALDAATGKQIWKTNVEPHPRAVLSGAPVLYKDKLYVPVSSWEETISSVAQYECCTFRGSVAALDTQTGHIDWHTYVMPEAKPYKKNAAGTRMLGPAGAAIWSAPTIDPKRGVLYVTTGDSYTEVKEDDSDAVMALDLKTGAIKWKHQMTADDNFLTGCPAGRPSINCPTPTGPDWDFGASAILKHLSNGKDMLLAGQKSGQVYGINPDTGAILWAMRFGKGGGLGGVEWGMAADNDNVYAAVNQGGTPGLYAMRMTDGMLAWQQTAPSPAKCSFKSGRCSDGYSAPPTVANGVVYAPNQDGHIRAFDAKTGAVVWDYDAGAMTYDTVNGVKEQRGANFDGSGMAFAGDMAFTMSGYNGASGSSGPNNVLLAFSVDGK